MNGATAYKEERGLQSGASETPWRSSVGAGRVPEGTRRALAWKRPLPKNAFVKKERASGESVKLTLD